MFFHMVRQTYCTHTNCHYCGMENQLDDGELTYTLHLLWCSYGAMAFVVWFLFLSICFAILNRLPFILRFHVNAKFVAIVNVENLNEKQGERLHLCLTSNNEHSMFVTERVLCKRAFGYA